MKPAHGPILAVALLLSSPALTQTPPRIDAETFPTHGLESAHAARAILPGGKTKVAAVVRRLADLGAAAQFPCAYCIRYHARKARALGATEAEVREAVSTAADVRHWSTVLNGMAYDPERLGEEIDRMFEGR